MLVSFSLLPTQADADAVIRLARQVLARPELTIVPHLTVVLLETDMPLEELARLRDKVIFGSLRLAGNGLALLPSHHGDDVWLEVPVMKTRALVALQDEIIAKLPGLSPVNAIDDDYRPHLTLGRVGRGEVAGLDVSLDPDVLRREFGFDRLVVAQHADDYSVSKLLVG